MHRTAVDTSGCGFPQHFQTSDMYRMPSSDIFSKYAEYSHHVCVPQRTCKRCRRRCALKGWQPPRPAHATSQRTELSKSSPPFLSKQIHRWERRGPTNNRAPDCGFEWMVQCCIAMYGSIAHRERTRLTKFAPSLRLTASTNCSRERMQLSGVSKIRSHWVMDFGWHKSSNSCSFWWLPIR